MLRVLQVIDCPGRGGAETWLVHVLRSLQAQDVRIDFLAHRSSSTGYQTEIKGLGSRLFVNPYARQPLAYAAQFRKIVSGAGTYDVVHSHVDHYSGWVMRVASWLGIPCRIVHSHNDTTTVDAAANVRRRVYLRLMKVLIRRYATAGFATSESAASALFGSCWRSDCRWRIHYSCVDLSSFEHPVDKAAMRASLGIPVDAFVVGHVGRFFEQKNHRFLIEVARHLVYQRPNTHVVLVGDGPLAPMTRDAVRLSGIGANVHFLGIRDDVPKIMGGVFDVFLFPSLFEGLGLALVEAQAAGLVCFASEHVPREARAVPELLQLLPLEAGPAQWAACILARAPRAGSLPFNPIMRLRQAGFDVHQNALRLLHTYHELAAT